MLNNTVTSAFAIDLPKAINEIKNHKYGRNNI